jgi:SAM-dependent methyltransferase
MALGTGGATRFIFYFDRTLVAVQIRPRWRRLARRARSVAYHIITLADKRARWKSDTLLPPAHLRLYYYRTCSPKAFIRACENVRTELTSRGLRPEHRVLDIGSGIGNLALSLTGYLRGGYDGVEVHPEAVGWCQRAITPRHPTFRFHRADVSSSAYNPDGAVPASSYRFPFPDQNFDFIFLGSVFTHMLPDSVEHYIHEISRLLAADGVCVASYFLLNDESRAGIDRGHSFMSFGAQHPSGLCRLHDATAPEAAVALEETFVRRVHEQAGLRIRDIRRGRWWVDTAHDQDLLTVLADPKR